jgi:NADP-dependent 3-hydroxy acid dehydrogenase YdfG
VFVSEGAYVFITGRRHELDAAVKGDRRKCHDTVKRTTERIDILFANAGVARYAPFGTISAEFYDSIFNINVKGCFSRCRRRYC